MEIVSGLQKNAMELIKFMGQETLPEPLPFVCLYNLSEISVIS